MNRENDYTEEELEDALWEKIIGLGIGDLQ